MFAGPDRRYQQIALLLVAIGYFLTQVGMTLVTPITPTIATSLKVETNLASWILTGYTLFLGSWVLIAGRVGDLLGHGRVYAIGMLILTVATLGAGISADIWQLILFRCLQGFGGALTLATGFAILRAAFPERVQGRAIGLVLTATAVGGTIGILLGTQAVGAIGWRPLFLALVPFSVLGTIGSFVVLPRRDGVRPRKTVRLDLVGAGLFFVALTALSLSFSHLHDGPETFEAGWPFHTVAQVVALACFVLFVRHELRVSNPIFDIRHLRNGHFTTALGVHFILHMTMVGTTFTIPFVLERGLGLPPTHAGYVQATAQIMLFLIAFPSGWLYDRTGSLLIRAIGMGSLVAVLVVLASVGPQLPFLAYVVAYGLLGCTLGSVNTLNSALIMTVLPTQHRGIAAGTLETARQYGHTMGFAVASTLITIGNPNGLLSGGPVSWIGFQTTWLALGTFALAGVLLSLTRRRAPGRQEEAVARSAV